MSQCLYEPYIKGWPPVAPLRGAGSNLGQRGGGGGGGSISKKGTLFYFGKQAEKPNFKKIACLY